MFLAILFFRYDSNVVRRPGAPVVLLTMAEIVVSIDDPRGVCLGSLRPEASMVEVADAGVVAVAWLAAMGAPLRRGMVLCGTSQADVCYR